MFHVFFSCMVTAVGIDNVRPGWAKVLNSSCPEGLRIFSESADSFEMRKCWPLKARIR